MDGIDPREFGHLEAEVRHLRHQLAGMEMSVKALGKQMDDLHDLLAQVRGARWTLGALVTVGGVIGGAGAWLASALRLGPQ